MLSQENVMNLFAFLWPYTESFHSSRELSDFLGDSLVKTLYFPLQGAWVLSLVREILHASQCSQEQQNHQFLSNTVLIWLSRWFSWEEPTCWCRGLRFDPWVRKIPRRRKRQPRSILAWTFPMDRGAWRATVYGVKKELRCDWAHIYKLFLYSQIIRYYSSSIFLFFSSW